MWPPGARFTVSEQAIFEIEGCGVRRFVGCYETQSRGGTRLSCGVYVPVPESATDDGGTP